MLRIIGIQRAERFSPNSVDNDRAILEAVVAPLGGKIISEDDNIRAKLSLKDKPDVVFSMARDAAALQFLHELESEGTTVINPTVGVQSCRRTVIDAIMRENDVPVPPHEGSDGYWLKRGDEAAQSHDDIVFCRDHDELLTRIDAFKRRGINEFVVQAHVKGDLVKFYGVEGTGFFRTFYPSDDGKTKFGDELINGRAQHYDYPQELLRQSAELTSRLAHTPVYGGDAVVGSDGRFVIIDFNDWPSFSRCREEAAEAIKSLIK